MTKAVINCCACCFAVLPMGLKAADTSVDFNRDIRPMLSDKCFKCHGPDAAARKANLRLDLRQGLFSDRGGYASFVPGKPRSSEALRRITINDPDERMPPPDSDRKLTTAEIDVLHRWVEQGAHWKQNWLFEPVQQPVLPQVANRDWCRNAIDFFVAARLDRENLQPSPVASKQTLIRRVTLDLTGLPPTPAEVDAFLADDSANAYETVVDRLLRSRRYGEHMALMWLDAARYADTDGYQNDGPRYMWRWRDWVIEAYNANMPFNQFTIEQLAGDLLPGATLDQRIATGFNRNHRYNSEAGLKLDEFLLENAVDRVDTTSTVWMGLTMGCARCHDHKFDPFSQREYYQLIAFFDKVTESGRAVKFGNSEPWVVAPTKRQQAALVELDRRVEAAAQALANATSQIDAETERFQNQIVSQADGQFIFVDDREVRVAPSEVVTRGLTHYFSFSANDKRISAEQGQAVFRPGIIGQAASMGGQDVLALGTAGNVHCQERSSIAFWLRPQAMRHGAILSRQERNTRRPGFAVELRDGHLQFYIIVRWVSGVAAVESIQKLKPGHWTHVCLTNDGSQSSGGMKIFLNGQPAKVRSVYNTNSNTGGTAAKAVLRVGGGVHGTKFKGQLDELRFYNRTLWEDEIELLAEPSKINEILSRPRAERSEAETRKLRAWFLETTPLPVKQLAVEHFAARAARRKYWDELPTTMVMEEAGSPRPTHVRIRGVYNDLGPKVEPNIPMVLPALPRDYPRNRLGFARWLVDGRHPLTARVTINRYWQKYFGSGLVKTMEDFGVQGERPSHPQLLDWLAGEFVRCGWDVKAMQKLIVNSATYRQASRFTNLHSIDPENRLLARGPRRRLPAHVLRDQALYVGGLLIEKLGGPSVSPYQPADLWKEMSNMTYRQSKADDLYRRSLYTIWKRTVAPPSMAILDAADRESCWVRTKRTNTPLQALTLLNETAFVESARNLGQRMIREGGPQPVEFAFRLVMARRPNAEELDLLQRAREDYLDEYRRNPDDAKKLIAVGNSKPAQALDSVELAANTMLANILLNLDETITKE